MTSILQSLANAFIPQETTANSSFAVNLEKEYQRYSFLEHHPEQIKNINQLFQKRIRDASGDVVSVSSLLQSKYYREQDLILLKQLGFKQLSAVPQASLVLEHPSFPGWLIKKNFGFINGNAKVRRLNKIVSGSDFPFWMVPSDLANAKEICFPMPNDIIHPLRVAMLKRGRKWIKQLNLTHIRAVKEYLYQFPDVSSAKPLYERVVVISQKANILSDVDNLRRFATMAAEEPNRLAKVVNELVLLIRHWKLTDTHLLNFRFSNDGTDTLIATDGEPVGALADATQPEMVRIVGSFDSHFYSLLGLKNLQSSIEHHMEQARIDHIRIQKVQTIFDQKIDVAVNEILQESVWNVITKNICQASPEIKMACACYNVLKNQIAFYMNREPIKA